MAKKKTGHASHDKVVEQRTMNDGMVSESLKENLREYLKIENDIKMLNARKRDLRAKAKEDEGILKTAYALMLRLYKMEAPARAELIHSLKDMNTRLGDPLQMDFFINESIALHQEDLISSDPVENAKSKVANIKG